MKLGKQNREKRRTHAEEVLERSKRDAMRYGSQAIEEARAQTSTPPPLDPEDSISDEELEDVLREGEGVESDDEGVGDGDGEDEGAEAVNDTRAALAITAPETTQQLAAPHTILDFTPAMTEEAQRVARAAVERVLTSQAEQRLFDTIDQSQSRFVVELRADTQATLRLQWEEYNAALIAVGASKVPFSQFLSRRLDLCSSHNAIRPVYVNDDQRRALEELLDTSVLSGSQLVLEVDRRLRPILEFSDGQTMVIGPIDVRLLERVPRWFPDKPPAKAIGDYLIDAAMANAGY